ncbi:MAG: FtsX-like permease family protein, partial [Acidobacteria bacterium]|nr:FtsX-like permease family protein [Acidobacteriota bacterium]
LLGGAAGLLLAVWINRLLLALKPAVDLPLVLDLRLDWRVMGAAFALSLLTGVLFGLAPAWQSARPDVVVALKDEARSPSRHASRLRNAFVVAQIALSFLLLVCAGLFIRALSEGQKQFVGLDPERVQTVTYDPRFIGYDQQRAQEFYRQLLERARALPGVESTSLAAGVTVGGGGRNTDFEVARKDKRLELPVVHFNIVSPGYLATMKIRLLQGRDFSAADRTPGVAIIDETAAQQWFAGADVLGQRLIHGKTEFEIIGIAERANQRLSGVTAQPFIYLPYAPSIGDLFGTRMILHVRTALPSPEIYAALRREVGQLDRQIAAQYPMSLADYIRLATLPQRLVAALAGVLGLLGLALAAIGIFGVISYVVTQRTHEIGIRMALGAQPRDVLGLILRQGMSVIASGLTIGLLVAWATTRLLTALLYGVSATDPLTFGGVALLLLSIALLACYLPARKATKVDPLIALRHE